VFLDLSYFSPCDEEAKKAIETELGLERKVEGVVQRIIYGRTGAGCLYFKIPFESDLKGMFPFLYEEARLAEDVAHSISNGEYRLGFSTGSSNTYKFTLGLPNIHPSWKRKIRAVKGLFPEASLLGTAVAEEVYLSQRARRSDFEELKRQGIETAQKEIRHIDEGRTSYTNPVAARASLQDQLARLEGDESDLFEKFREQMGGYLKSHRQRLVEADERYGTDNKVAMSLMGGTSYLYLKDPVLERSISLGGVADYSVAKQFLSSVF
jgi:hypothetical protein